MKRSYALLLAFFICSSLNAKFFGIKRGFSPSAPVASHVDTSSLWYNPSGLGFLEGTNILGQYQYEWYLKENRHHGTFNIASQFFDFFTLGLGLNSRTTFAPITEQQQGSDFTWALGTAFRFKQTSLGLSLSKYHNFLWQTTFPIRYSLGFQSRFNHYIALGFSYEKIYKEFFSAPIMTLGTSLRPFKNIFTFGLDLRLFPKGTLFNEGFRYDPIFNFLFDYNGLNFGASIEIPDIRSGWNKPVFGILLDANFGFLSLGLLGNINKRENNYSIGGKTTLSSLKSPSILKEQKKWVKLEIDEEGSLSQKPPSNILLSMFSRYEHPLNVLALLRKIKNDPSIDGITLDLKGFNFGMGNAEEWHNIILSLKKSEKKVHIYLNKPSERDYYIALAADKIYMNKNTSISLSIFRSNLLHIKDTLAKIGVRATDVHAGTYKTAPRMFTNNKPSKEEIEVVDNILTNFYNEIINKTALIRNIKIDVVKNLFDDGDITAKVAKELNLVDELINGKDLKEPLYADNYKNQSWQAPKAIAVIPIYGTIKDGYVSPKLFPSTGSSAGALDIIESIENAIGDPEVLSIIIRIDSPGGSAEAGHAIHDAILKAKKVKPIVVSMADTAASAGYLIASASDHIYTQNNTITGSIGVWSLHFDGEDLMSKIGANVFEIKKIENPGPSLFRGFTQKEFLNAQKNVNWYYDNFLNSVSTSLSLDKEYLKSVAEGRVWLGKEALERNLIHHEGGFLDAIEKAKELSNAQKEEIYLSIKTPGSFGGFSSIKFMKSYEAEEFLKHTKPFLKYLEIYQLNDSIQARLPFILETGK